MHIIKTLRLFADFGCSVAFNKTPTYVTTACFRLDAAAVSDGAGAGAGKGDDKSGPPPQKKAKHEEAGARSPK